MDGRTAGALEILLFNWKGGWGSRTHDPEAKEHIFATQGEREEPMESFVCDPGASGFDWTALDGNRTCPCTLNASFMLHPRHVDPLTMVPTLPPTNLRDSTNVAGREEHQGGAQNRQAAAEPSCLVTALTFV